MKTKRENRMTTAEINALHDSLVKVLTNDNPNLKEKRANLLVSRFLGMSESYWQNMRKGALHQSNGLPYAPGVAAGAYLRLIAIHIKKVESGNLSVKRFIDCNEEAQGEIASHKAYSTSIKNLVQMIKREAGMVRISEIIERLGVAQNTFYSLRRGRNAAGGVGGRVPSPWVIYSLYWVYFWAERYSELPKVDEEFSDFMAMDIKPRTTYGAS